jgi:alkanesulfonate monooxygenase SsuD/methylene tetrahydromethanopterin reductase-like flavin-dependent oxidoreductase (luciferase family)
MSEIRQAEAGTAGAITDREQRAPLGLGLFMPNCSNAYSISTYKPVPADWTYEANAQIARAAETAGFDFLFPVAKWKGYGGTTDYLGTSLETMTWASALLATTERIQVFSTVHVPIFHPLVAAKMGATLDHIGKGRWGLNVVSGWSEREFGMMGIEVLPHAERYERTAAYIEIIKGLWTFDERHRILEQMDREAAENWARGLIPQSGSFDQFTLEMFALGASGLPIFGTRDQVAESLDRLYRSGMDGVLMVFLSYYEDTLRFEREIMPLLRQLGTIR